MGKEQDYKWAEENFWVGFMKQAMSIKIPRGMPKAPKLPTPPSTTPKIPLPPQGVPRMSEVAQQATKKQIKPAAEPLNYAKINEIKQVPEEMAATLKYTPGAKPTYTPPKTT